MSSRSVGDMLVTAVSDGRFFAPHDAILDFDPQKMTELTGVPVGQKIPFEVYCFLVRTADRTVLIDVGGGAWTSPTLGRLVGNLQALGVGPEAVDTILLTHCHPDHSNGLIAADGKPVFPNAALILHENEAAFWLDRDVTDADSERIRRNIKNAQAAVTPYASRMRRVAEGEVLPGFHAVLRAGHTPGHTTWLLQSRQQRMLVWGDTVHFANVQVAHPNTGLVFDVDPVAACRSRGQVLEWAASEQVVVAGAHLSAPGFGRIGRGPSGFVLQQAEF